MVTHGAALLQLPSPGRVGRTIGRIGSAVATGDAVGEGAALEGKTPEGDASEDEVDRLWW